LIFFERSGVWLKPVVFKGSGCALVTPMTQDDKINYDVLEKLIEFQINNGTSALIVCATTGESSTLTDVEYASLIRFAKDTAKGRIPIIAGSGTNSTTATIKKCKTAEKMGADALLVVTPYYNRPTQDGLWAHFKAVSEASSLPVILYDVPSRTGISLEADTAAKLSELDNIVGLKAASTDLKVLSQIRFLCGDKLSIYSGNDELTAPIFSLGGIGAISVAANICPKEFSRLCESGLDGDLKILSERQVALTPLFNALSCSVNPVAIKELMCIAGIPVGGLRLPLCGLSEEMRNTLREYAKNSNYDLRGYFL